MEIRKYVEERISKNKLPLDIDEVVNLIKEYKDIYPDVSEMGRFFHVIKNKVGSIINNIDHNTAEFLGWLKIRSVNDIYFFKFEEEEDYYSWLEYRINIYNKITNKEDIRLLNYLELSTINLVKDILTESEYLLFNDIESFIFKKNGYNVDKETKSFIKYISEKFTNDYLFKPIK